MKLQLIIKSKLRTKLKHFVDAWPNNEFSGPIYIKVVESNNNIELHALDCIILAKGTSSFTTHINDGREIDYLLDHPELDGCIIGNVHSHNGMATFFSGTDMRDLMDKADNYENYVSLITNNKEEFIAKTTYASPSKVCNLFGKEIQVNNVSYGHVDLEIVTEPLDESLVDKKELNLEVDKLNREYSDKFKRRIHKVDTGFNMSIFDNIID